MQMLVDKGAEVNKADDDGLTPLHRSARKGNVDMVSLLVANGADLNVKDRWVMAVPSTTFLLSTGHNITP